MIKKEFAATGIESRLKEKGKDRRRSICRCRERSGTSPIPHRRFSFSRSPIPRLWPTSSSARLTIPTAPAQRNHLASCDQLLTMLIVIPAQYALSAVLGVLVAADELRGGMAFRTDVEVDSL